MRASYLSSTCTHGFSASSRVWLLVSLVQYGSCHATRRCLPAALAAPRSVSSQVVAALALVVEYRHSALGIIVMCQLPRSNEYASPGPIEWPRSCTAPDFPVVWPA